MYPMSINNVDCWIKHEVVFMLHAFVFCDNLPSLGLVVTYMTGCTSHPEKVHKFYIIYWLYGKINKLNWKRILPRLKVGCQNMLKRWGSFLLYNRSI